MLKKFTHGNHENMTLERNLHFDGWRGMAIVLVLISHFLTIPGFYAGKLGVASFFALSGALMSNILFIKKTPLALFYKRRISRILPLFFIYVSVTYIYAAFIDSAESVNYLYTISFLRAYMPALPDMWSTNIPINHLWSLNVEEHCYILLSLVTLFKILKGKECYLLIFLGLCATLLYGFYIHNAEIAPPLFQIRTEVISSFLLISAGYLLISKQIETYVRPWMVLMALIIAVICFFK